MSLPIAVQLYSIAAEVKADFKGALKKVKDMGYDGVEFAGLFGQAPREIREWCREIGLVPVSAHVAVGAMIENPERVFADYGTIGCRYVGIPSLPEQFRPGGKDFDQFVQHVNSFAKIAAAHGITLVYHNHDFEFQKIGGAYLLDLLFDSFPAEILQTEIDVCWVKVGGEDPAEYLMKYQGRSPIVHLKDFRGRRDRAHYELIDAASSGKEPNEAFGYAILGTGLQDMPSILAACKNARAQWAVVELDAPDRGYTALESIQKSIEYLRSAEW